MFDRAAIVRPLGCCRICCGRSKQRRQARGAPGRSSIYTFSARAPSRLLPLPLLSVVHTFQQPIRWRVYSSMSRPRERSSAQKSASLFSGALTISLFISVDRLAIDLMLGELPYAAESLNVRTTWYTKKLFSGENKDPSLKFRLKKSATLSDPLQYLIEESYSWRYKTHRINLALW